MQEPSKNNAPQVPPDVARYLRGAPPESRQFDFLIGEWQVAATRYGEDGLPLLDYKASWSAKSLNGNRMIVDDFKACAPTGQDVSSYVTLRTYCETTRRWEMVGLSALQPAVPAQWHGEFKDGEMQLEASGKDPAGQLIRTRISFSDIQENSFRWESRVSRDDGKTWKTGAVLLASRMR